MVKFTRVLQQAKKKKKQSIKEEIIQGKIGKELKNKGLPGSAATVWRYCMCQEKDGTFETKKAPTSEQQRVESLLGICSQIS